MFDLATRVSRQPHWYVEGAIPDTLDGRFAVLATVLALIMVRLETDGEQGNVASVALTERFIEVMESEHRELGIGDPALGRTVRKLVGKVARRTEAWRQVRSREKDASEAARESLYRNNAPPDALRHCVQALKRFEKMLISAPLEEIEQGKIL